MLSTLIVHVLELLQDVPHVRSMLSAHESRRCVMHHRAVAADLFLTSHFDLAKSIEIDSIKL